MKYRNEQSERLAKLLKTAGIATKDVECYGSQVVVTCWSMDMANRVASSLTAATFKLRGIVKAIDYAKENKHSAMLPSTLNVYRVFATV